MKSQDGKDPYLISRHRDAKGGKEACDGEPVYWINKRKYVFISQQELDERECPACDEVFNLYDTWMHYFSDPETGELADPREIDRAYLAMDLEQNFNLIQPRADEISPREYAYICVVKAEQNKFVEQKRQIALREAERNSRS